ncbi:MAG: NAD(P)H-binding protein [Phycisphaerales bacterium]|nr:NAD(P)H-binding protein [Phycisphaerales bacterium]
MSESPEIKQVMVTGATGFVGRSVVRELLARGLTPVCLVRSAEKLYNQHREVDPQRLVPIVGDLGDDGALRHAAELTQAAIHLVGIIIARLLRGQTFQRVHVRGTKNIVDAVRDAGIRRYAHMSALGTRPDALATYHKTKWSAEEYVRGSGLDWTIFRPSVIHGPSGEFMQLMKRFMCGLVPPIVPYFGSGTAKLQPVSVKDVAYCFVQSLFEPATIGKVIPLGGPRAYSWIELYNACRALMPGAKRWKPLVSQPVPIAKAAALLSTPVMGLVEMIVPRLGLFRFDAGQVQMSQEDSVCDHTIAEKLFNIKMRNFEQELEVYAGQIR